MPPWVLFLSFHFLPCHCQLQLWNLMVTDLLPVHGPVVPAAYSLICRCWPLPAGNRRDTRSNMSATSDSDLCSLFGSSACSLYSRRATRVPVAFSFGVFSAANKTSQSPLGWKHIEKWSTTVFNQDKLCTLSSRWIEFAVSVSTGKLPVVCLFFYFCINTFIHLEAAMFFFEKRTFVLQFIDQDVRIIVFCYKSSITARISLHAGMPP